MLYLHTNMRGDWSQGEDLPTMIESLEIPKEQVLIANQYRVNFAPAPAKMMAALYNTFDVFLNPAMGEGFGLPIMEAQACGVPAIVTDFSAMKEVCGAGWKVPADAYWTGQKSWQAMPRVEEIVKALEECYGLTTDERVALSAGRAEARAQVRGAEGAGGALPAGAGRGREAVCAQGPGGSGEGGVA